MDILKFTLSGKSAFFKKPDVNTYFYFTYGNIHKVALLGIFGAILGYGGYTQQIKTGAIYPEFYERLRTIQIAIVPKNPKGHIVKKVQTFNNTVGYANKDGNLIVREQWLENPEWDIYIQIHNETEETLADRIMNGQATYIPYLGKNEHLANISQPMLVRYAEEVNNVNRIHSLFVKEYFEIGIRDSIRTLFQNKGGPIFKYEEGLPVSLEKETNQYQLKSMVYTNENLKQIKAANIFKCGELSMFFF